MEHHLERGVRLNTDTQYKGLYSWCLQETDENGQSVGRDLIPWSYSLYFDVSAIRLIASTEFGSLFRENPDDESRARVKRFIRAELAPEREAAGRVLHRSTTYSMVGTERRDVKLELFVEPTSEKDPEEGCRVWGSPSYTHESDFTHVTEPDVVTFSLRVPPESFDIYARQIESDAVTHASFMVGRVSGFYSEWSPSISTAFIKILTNSKEHQIDVPEGTDIKVPTLGTVGEARFTLWKSLDLGASPQSVSEPVTDFVTKAMPAPEDPRHRHNVERLLASLQVGIWLAVVLLVILAFK